MLKKNKLNSKELIVKKCTDILLGKMIHYNSGLLVLDYVNATFSI